jgi:acyl carrier protein
VTRDEIALKLTEVLVTEFRVPKEKVQPDATFRGALGLDSLDATDLVFLLCKQFGLKPDLHSFRDLHTVAKVVDHLHAEVAKKK